MNTPENLDLILSRQDFREQYPLAQRGSQESCTEAKREEDAAKDMIVSSEPRVGDIERCNSVSMSLFMLEFLPGLIIDLVFLQERTQARQSERMKL